ncbi:MAG: hypothetical protein HY847_05690 [Betaproteobacteria bacterium]|nr:hypothetical protein [Betaproteobacteria bacterium]
MIAALHDLIRQALAFSVGFFVAALFAVGVFFALSLLLVPLAALRKGNRRDGASIEQNQTKE